MYETAQTSALSWLKMLEYFGKYETNSPQLTGKRSSTPLDSLLILACVSIRRMGWFCFSWLTSHARRLFRHRVNNTDIDDTSEMICEPYTIMSEPRTSFSRRLSSVRLFFDMASTVLNGNNRSEKWHRPFTKGKFAEKTG